MSEPRTLVDPHAGPTPAAIAAFTAGMSRFRHFVARSDDLTDGAVLQSQPPGKPVAPAPLDGELTAVLDVCRHHKAQLSRVEIAPIDGRQGTLGPCHGWACGIGRACFCIPQFSENRRIPPSAAGPAFQGPEGSGSIWVCLAFDPIFDRPVFRGFDGPSVRALRRLAEDVPDRPQDLPRPLDLRGELRPEPGTRRGVPRSRCRFVPATFQSIVCQNEVRGDGIGGEI